MPIIKATEYIQLKLGETKKKSLPFHNKTFSSKGYKKLAKLINDFLDKEDLAAGKN